MKTKVPTRIAIMAAAVLCLFSLCNSSKVYGQDFQNLLNNNAEWYYEIQPFIGCLPCVVRFQHIKAVRDTLINNQECVILEKSNSGDIDICDIMGTALEYLYADEQKVYWYNEHLDDFTILYDFSAETGGSWEIQVLDCTLLVTVDSTSTFIINSQERKILYISDENNFFTGSVIEGIGHTRNMFPSGFFYYCQGVACDSDFIDGLRCYLENQVILYKPAIADCEEVYTLSVGEPYILSKIKYYPNPARDELNISLPDNFHDCHTISIFDLSGRLLLQEVHCGNAFRVNVRKLQPGFYLLRVMHPIGIIDQKFLKH